MNRSVAVITARGGSKRIPRKNIKEFCGKPIIAYSIEEAIASGIFDEVMVSTDDDEIAQTAKKYGARVPFMRSSDTSDDHTTTAEVLLEVLEAYHLIGRDFDKMCCIYPTAPFITKEKLREGMKQLEYADSVIPVVRFSFPPQRSFVANGGRLQWKWEKYRNTRSQDLEPYYHDCGQFYCVNVKRFLDTKELIMENTAPIIMSELEVQDIDNIEDWELAEVKYRKIKGTV